MCTALAGYPQGRRGGSVGTGTDCRALFLPQAGLPFMDLRMAVLVMRVVPAQYAFVIHTMNPATRDETEVYCELVKGLGETLVSGQFPGKSMAFR